MALFRENAPAKINLTLEVLGKRPDGYHELKSLVAFADVGDVVTMDTSKADGVTVSGPFGQTIAGQNLVETTLRLLSEANPGLVLGAVHLEKNLPVAAGIGGGSADAAAVIRAVQKANPDRIESVDWRRIAMRIGADVPVCMVSHLSWMRGIGEVVAPLSFDEPVRVDAIIVNPLMAVPDDKTAQVFRAYAAQSETNAARQENHPAIRNRDDLMHAICGGWNDLQFAAWRTMPAIDEVMQAVPAGRVRRMSGAGPSFFSIFDDAAAAAKAAAALELEHPNWWVKAVTLG